MMRPVTILMLLGLMGLGVTAWGQPPPPLLPQVVPPPPQPLILMAPLPPEAIERSLNGQLIDALRPEVIESVLRGTLHYNDAVPPRVLLPAPLPQLAPPVGAPLGQSSPPRKTWGDRLNEAVRKRLQTP